MLQLDLLHLYLSIHVFHNSLLLLTDQIEQAEQVAYSDLIEWLAGHPVELIVFAC